MASTVNVDGAWTFQLMDTALIGRLHDGAFLQNASATPNSVWRSGVIPSASTTISGTPVVTDLRVTQQSSPALSVQVNAGDAVIQRSGQGPYIAINTSTRTLTLQNPPDATNPRIDLVYFQLLDQAFSDPGAPASGGYAQLGVKSGTANPSPTAPSVPTNAIPLAQLAIAANATQITTSNITDERKAAGTGARLLMAGDLITDPGFLAGERRRRVLSNYGNVVSEEYWGADGVWHGTQPLLVPYIQQQPVNQFLAYPSTAICKAVIPDPGWPYYIRAGGKVGGSSLSSGGQIYTQLLIDNATTGAVISTAFATFGTGAWESANPSVPAGNGTPTAYTGSHTIWQTLWFVATGQSANLSGSATDFYLDVEIVPA